MNSLSKSILLLLTVLVLSLTIVTPVRAHGGTHGELWQRWAWQDLSWLLLIGGVYALGLRALWMRAGTGSGISRGRAAAFGAGMIVLFISIVSPLDALSEELFAAHMIQHLLLILVVAPLFVIGRYTLAVGWAFPARWNTRIWKDWKWKDIWSFLTRPMVAFLFHNAAVWLWHMPRFYEAALANEWLHFLEHASFFLTAFIFWQVFADLTQNMYRGRAVGVGLAIFLVFGTMLISGFLGALLAFSQYVWFPSHIHDVALYGLTALEDQQLAGTIMWVPAGVVYTGLAIGVMGRWLFAMEAREKSRA
jgi:putative membrane protein